MTTKLTLRSAKTLTTIELIRATQEAHEKLGINASDITAKRNYMCATNELLQRFSSLISSNIARYQSFARSQNAVAIDFDELKQCAHLGFINAVINYDDTDFVFETKLGDTLATYAAISIKREITDFIQKNTSTVAESRTRSKQLAAQYIRKNSNVPTEVLSRHLVEEYRFRNMRYARMFVVQTLNAGTRFTSLNADNESYGEKGEDFTVTSWLQDDEAISTERRISAKFDHAKIKDIWQRATGDLAPIPRICYLLSKGLTPDMQIAERKFKLREISDFLAEQGITLRGNKPMSSENVRLYIKNSEKIIQSKMQQKCIPEEYFA